MIAFPASFFQGLRVLVQLIPGDGLFVDLAVKGSQDLVEVKRRLHAHGLDSLVARLPSDEMAPRTSPALHPPDSSESLLRGDEGTGGDAP